jgi:iduronate 2-sulfatase
MKNKVSFTALLFTALLGLSSYASAAPIKNVLFLISDDLKASVLGCYGDTICKTPNIDRLAKQSVVFDRAYCQGTSCGPSRQSFMFSRYQGTANVNMGQHFKNNGWYSARVGKIYHMRVPGDIIAGTNGADVESSWTERFNSKGLEAHTPGDYACFNLNIFTNELEGRQSTQMPHRMFVEVRYDGDGSDQPDHKTATKTMELLQKHKDSPFFLAAGFVRPHYPMVAPRQYFEPYDWKKITLPEVPEGDLNDIPKLGIASTKNATNPIGEYPDNQKRMWAAYYASVQFMDEQVGRIIDELDRLGLRESTAIVFTSDHGYHLGEHTFWQKSNLHEDVLRVPLIISAPGFTPGRSSSIVELVDMFPTLSDLAGLDIPESVQGKSLVPILQDTSATVKDSALSFNKGHGMRTAHWSYMRYNDQTEELYDMDKDAQQFTNQATNPEYAAQVKRMRTQLDQRLQASGLKKNTNKNK